MAATVLGVFNELNSRVHSGPNCWTDRSTGDVYVGWYDDQLYGHIAKIEPNGTVTTQALAALSGNPLNMPADSAEDEHLALVLALDDERKLLVAANMHNDPMRCIRFSTAGAVSGAFTSMASTFEVDTGEGYTYPRFQSMSDGRLVFCCRRRVADASNNIGRFSIWMKALAGAWSHVDDVTQDMPHDATAFGPEDVGDFLGYAQFIITPDDVWRVATHWVDWGTSLSKEDVGYIQSTDQGATWRTAGGTLVTTPIEYANRAAQLADSPGGGFNASTVPTVDGDGNPAIVVTDLFDDVYLVRFNGSTWASTLHATSYTAGCYGVYFRDDLWVLGTRQNRATLTRAGASTVRKTFGNLVHDLLEPCFDPEALRLGRVRSAFPTASGPTYRDYGELLNLLPP